MDDRTLVDRFLKSRSEEAFSNLYRNKTPRLYQMALRLSGQNTHQAEELIQDMWVIAIGKLVDFEWRSELKTWLIGILINLARKKRKQEEKEMNVLAEFKESEEIIDEIVFTEYDLEKAIGALPPGYKQIIILHDIEGYTHREIAEVLDISEGTSKSQLYHARRTLRNYLSEDHKKTG